MAVRESDIAEKVLIHHFPLTTAGATIATTSSDFTSYQESVGDRNIYAPFASKIDWEIARWTKLHGPSSSAMTELLGFEGVRYSIFEIEFNSVNLIRL
jgi:hypothetical protein